MGTYGTEEANAYEVATKVVNILKTSGLFKAVYGCPRGYTLSQSIAYANQIGATHVLDIHSDAGGGTGATALYKSEAGKSWITDIYNRVALVNPASDRGIKQRTDLGILNQTNGIVGLIELFFHDNPEDVKFYQEHKDQYAMAIANGICDYFGVAISVVNGKKNGWYQESIPQWYFYENDVMVKDGYRNDSHGKCYLTATGAWDGKHL